MRHFKRVLPSEGYSEMKVQKDWNTEILKLGNEIRVLSWDVLVYSKPCRLSGSKVCMSYEPKIIHEAVAVNNEENAPRKIEFPFHLANVYLPVPSNKVNIFQRSRFTTMCFLANHALVEDESDPERIQEALSLIMRQLLTMFKIQLMWNYLRRKLGGRKNQSLQAQTVKTKKNQFRDQEDAQDEEDEEGSCLEL
ncbi:hypothetical protein POM88_005442 [Heracleum sosnowskyi]|uniref:Uncharacterized protein n=1 Tax=Heracleum sosnowskyi TaxID=360622 RepID=A0AAD8J2A2_9APIA|nr:hypothetical protein POM88_005442 [Heracleum sosnowskyi]